MLDLSFCSVHCTNTTDSCKRSSSMKFAMLSEALTSSGFFLTACLSSAHVTSPSVHWLKQSAALYSPRRIIGCLSHYLLTILMSSAIEARHRHSFHVCLHAYHDLARSFLSYRSTKLLQTGHLWLDLCNKSRTVLEIPRILYKLDGL